MKGITPVVAIILLLLVTISFVGFALMFFQRTSQQAGEEVQQQLEQQISAAAERFEIVSIDQNKVYVKNTGTANLQNLAFYVDGNQISNTSPFSIPPNTVGEVLLNNSQLAMVPGDKLRVTSVGYAQEQTTKFYDKNTVAYWRFDDGERAAIKDYSGNGNDGTFVGETWNDGDLKPACPNCPAQTTGKYGNALSFDGSVDHRVSIPDSNSLDLSSLMTITLWIKLPSIQTDERKIIFKNAAYQIRTNPPGESPRIAAFLWIGGNGEPRISLPTAEEETNKWMHLAITYDANDGTNNFKLYKNAILKAQTTRTGNIDASTNNLEIGASVSGGSINAVIDEVRIYNKALTAQEILDDMNSAHPVARTVASYSFENGAQDTHNIVKGKYGAAMSFDGVDDKISIPNRPSLSKPNDFTIELWMKASSTQGAFYDPISKGHTSTKGWVFQGSTAPGGKLAALFGKGDSIHGVQYTPDLRDNTWHHLVAVKSSVNGATTYLDGNQDTNNLTMTYDVAGIGDYDLTIGADTLNGRNFNGAIDEVRILNVAVS